MGVTIEDVGPIRSLAFNLDGEGGVCVFKGRNGTGKSHGIAALTALTDKKRARALDARDGSERGIVEGFGVSLTIGRRSNARGELLVEAIDADDPSTLVDPGVKDEAVADERRIQVLARLAGCKPSIAAFAALLGPDEYGEGRLRAICRPATLEMEDLPAMAEAIRRDLQAAARAAESTAENHGGKAAALYESTRDVDLEAPHDATALAAASESAARAVMEAETALRHQRRVQADADKARAELDRLEASPVGEPAEGVEASIEASIADFQRDADAAEAESKRQLAMAEDSRMKIRGLRMDLENVKKQREAHASRRSTVEALRVAVSTEAGSNVSEETLDQLREARATANKAQEQGAVIRRAREQRATADTEMELARSARKSADDLRGAAKAVDDVVSGAISSLSRSGLAVRNGRLVVATDRGEELFSQLSSGERWKVALDVAIDAVGENGLLAIKQEAWEGLDPENRTLIARHARERQVWIVTAQADGGDLRAEVFTEACQ